MYISNHFIIHDERFLCKNGAFECREETKKKAPEGAGYFVYPTLPGSGTKGVGAGRAVGMGV